MAETTSVMEQIGERAAEGTIAALNLGEKALSGAVEVVKSGSDFTRETLGAATDLIFSIVPSPLTKAIEPLAPVVIRARSFSTKAIDTILRQADRTPKATRTIQRISIQ